MGEQESAKGTGFSVHPFCKVTFRLTARDVYEGEGRGVGEDLKKGGSFKHRSCVNPGCFSGPFSSVVQGF